MSDDDDERLMAQLRAEGGDLGAMAANRIEELRAHIERLVSRLEDPDDEDQPF